MHKDLEAQHRITIQQLNADRRLLLQYFKDVEVEETILPLVRLMNNRWTLTAHSCEGHFDRPEKYAQAYVSFFVMADQCDRWTEIETEVFNSLIDGGLTKEMTLDVTQNYELPERTSSWIRWGFGPTSRNEAFCYFDTEEQYKASRDDLLKKVAGDLSGCL